MDLQNVKWIASGEDVSSPQFCRDFEAKAGDCAEIAICGLGYFELFLNGKKVSDDVLNPVWSNYEPRENRRLLYPIHDEMRTRVYFRVYDVTEYIKDGVNRINVWLGNGWYDQRDRNVEGDLWYGTKKLAYRLKVGDLVVESDENTIWRESEIIYNNLYFGEVHDMSKADYAAFLPENEFIGAPSVYADAPKAEMNLQTCPSDNVNRVIVPRFIGKRGKAAIYDCGEVVSGRVVLKSANKKQTVTLRFAEVRNEAGDLLYYSTSGTDGQMQKDEFICDGEYILCPRFVWHGFRYFEVEGDAKVIKCESIAAAIPVTAEFHSDNATLNWLFDAFLRTEESCLHGGVSTDSSNRERLGYTGDGQLTAEAVLLAFDSAAFYEKWMQDIFDSQDMTTGHVPHTAPFYGGGGGPGCWGGAVVVVPWALYRKCGDLSVLARALPHILKYLEYMVSHSEDGLVVREEENGWCLGDWCSVGGEKKPAEFVNTYYLMKFIDLLTQIDNELGGKIDLAYWAGVRTVCAESMTRHFFDESTGDFCQSVQGSNALAADVGLGDGRTVDNLCKKYDNEHIDSGIVGTDVMLRVLFEKGRSDTAVKLLTDTGYPSFDYWREQGATTLWENWEGKDCSHAHQMFGGVTRYLFTYLLGIRQEKTGQFVVDPCFTDRVRMLSGSILTRFGRISVKISNTAENPRIRVKKDPAVPLTVRLNSKETVMTENDITFAL